MTERRGQHPAAGQAWLRWSWQRSDKHRIVTVFAAAALAAAITMAVFGLPPVDLHGPLHRVGIMDPLCGGTRAARYTVLGDWTAAWRYNPVGILAVVAAAAVTLRAVVGMATSRWLTPTLTWTARSKRIAATVGVVAFAAMTVRQQLIADLLTAGG